MPVAYVSTDTLSHPRNTLFSKLLLGGASGLAILAAQSLVALPADALPQGSRIISGNVVISTPETNRLLIQQNSQRAIVNWQSFNIAPTETVRIEQENANQTLVNRIQDVNPSKIYGTLEATGGGTVLLLNPNGVVFGPDSQIDVNRLVVSTSDINRTAFTSTGELKFTGGSKNEAAITNYGTITAEEGGAVVLVAPQVANHGTIKAPEGKVALANGEVFTVDLTGGDGLINIAVPSSVATATGGAPATVWNSTAGRIEADGGEVLLTSLGAHSLYDHAINMDGIIQAHGGNVILHAGHKNQATGEAVNKGVVEVQGSIDASAGGNIAVHGQVIRLENGSSLDASGGGKILVGGKEADPLGGDVPLAVGLFVGFNSEQKVDVAGDLDRMAYIVYHEGNSGVVWVSSHDGGLEPDEIRNRSSGKTGRDNHATVIMHEAADAFYEQTGATIHTVEANIARLKVDLNRSLESGEAVRRSERDQGEESLAVQIHIVWHDFNDEAVTRAAAVGESSPGLRDGEVYYIDWHGYGSDRDPDLLPDVHYRDYRQGTQPIEVNLGYDLRVERIDELYHLLSLENPTEEDLAQINWILERSSLNGIQDRMSREEIKDFVFGEASFGHFISQAAAAGMPEGYIVSVTPSPDVPIAYESESGGWRGPDGDQTPVIYHYQAGGYNIDRHTVTEGFHGRNVHGLQMEVPGHLRWADGSPDRGGVNLRSAFAVGVGQAMGDFLSLNYSVDYNAKNPDNYRAPTSPDNVAVIPVAGAAPEEAAYTGHALPPCPPPISFSSLPQLDAPSVSFATQPVMGVLSDPVVGALPDPIVGLSLDHGLGGDTLVIEGLEEEREALGGTGGSVTLVKAGQ